MTRRCKCPRSRKEKGLRTQSFPHFFFLSFSSASLVSAARGEGGAWKRSFIGGQGRLLLTSSAQRENLECCLPRQRVRDGEAASRRKKDQILIFLGGITVLAMLSLASCHNISKVAVTTLAAAATTTTTTTTTTRLKTYWVCSIGHSIVVTGQSTRVVIKAVRRGGCCMVTARLVEKINNEISRLERSLSALV